MIITKRNYNRPEYGDDADILKVSDNFTTEELQLDAINGATWGGYVDLDTDVVEIDKIYIDKRDSKQWLMLSSGNFNTVSKLELSLSNLLEITSKLKPRYSISCSQSGANYNIELSETRMPYVLEKIVLEFNATNIGNDTATISNGISPIIYQLKKQDNLGNVIPVIAGDIVIGTAYAGTFGMNDDIIVAIQSFNVTSTTDGITVANGKDLTLNVINDLTNTSATKPLSANMGKTLQDTKFNNIGTEIPASADLNTYRTCGHYKCATSANAGTILNNPFGNAAFTMIVDSITGNNTTYVVQTATAHHNGQMRTRVTIDNITWTPWVADLTENSPPVPVGGILVMADNTSPADKYPGTTWSIIADDKVLRGGNQSTVNATGGSNTKTIAVENLPAHTFTRGTMDIIGHISPIVDYSVVGSGPFYRGVASPYTAANGSSEYYINVEFQASRAWTGASSSVGSGTAFDVTPAYTKLVFWKRLT